jgi:hypothetical protein
MKHFKNVDGPTELCDKGENHGGQFNKRNGYMQAATCRLQLSM